MLVTEISNRFSLIEPEPALDRARFAEDVRRGLGGSPKRIPCRWLYDERGSRLFEEICGLREYYLTAAERAILLERAGEIAALFPRQVEVVELGSGNSSKTRVLLDAFLGRRAALRYVPVDISAEVLRKSSLALVEDHPDLDVLAVAAEYEEGLRAVARGDGRPRLVLWLGSSLGNLDRAEAAAFLARLRGGLLPGDRLLIGIDLRKDPRVLELAYDDPEGVTARFDLNLLARINRELGGRFRPWLFRHRAVYHREEGRVELGLVSLRDQRVAIEGLGREAPFRGGELLHTEDSFKYSPEEVEALAAAAGLRVERAMQDRAGRFSLNLLAPP